MKGIQWLLVLTLAACQSKTAIWNTAANKSAEVLQLWWVLFTAFVGVFLIVLVLAGAALVLKSSAGVENSRTLSKVFVLGVVLTCLTLLSLVVISFRYSTPNPSSSQINNPGFANIEVNAKMWWWQVKYFDERGQLLFETANEIHIPQNKRLWIRLKSDNVIHSFWVPQLSGKVDLIPGHPNYIELEANRPGMFRGRCAEYCGLQHTRMDFLVRVIKQEKYEKWLKSQAEPAIRPNASSQQMGIKVFENSDCDQCHQIRGLFERRRFLGPDLTHLKSRSTLASGTVSNNRGNLAGWISDPQGIKPGAKMPAVKLNSADHQSLLRFLESLK